MDQRVPELTVEVDGTAITPEMRTRIRSLDVDRALNVAGHFKMVFSDPGFIVYDADTFDFGKEVEIKLGYLGELGTVIKGKITRRELDLKGSGAPELTIVGTDPLALLRRKRNSRSFLEQKSSDVISTVASDHGLNAECDDSGAAEAYIFQNNVSDFDFVLELASEAGFDVWHDGEKLHCKRPDYKPTPVAELKWEENLMAFRPRFSTATSASKVEVRGWDPKTKKKINVVVSEDENKADGKSVLDLSGALAQVTRVSAQVASEAEAERLAKSILSRGAASGLTAMCEAAGNPAVQPPCMVKLIGVGDRLSGPYMVTKAMHRLGASGYMTLFEVRRNALSEPEPPAEEEAATQEDETVDIEIQIVDALGEPLPDTEYTITLADGSQRQGTTDGEGNIMESGVPKGSYRIEIPDADISVVGRTAT